ncbi:hypothetical protein LQG66_25715 [Bradyrhizobium ontarionense]|uniref:Uncharacterized protein n=1 Tax=Bradyrhizobium ontarionense TaxID=2898149 RepID=A0ABY3R6L6_9BRAD|nr:hypothetical protein [Bradyrhizobium sp. A19]UFZ02654.1 hypothetical protein LQG66_25715 [Bradyrhizobium sp. A19]
MVPIDQLRDFLADVETGWSLGTFGAIGEFTRDAGELVELIDDSGMIGAVTARGGICFRAHAELRLIASELPTRSDWSHRVALCLPRNACAMGQRTGITDLGPDRDALRPEDRDAVLFDLGLSTLQVDVCVRSRDPEVIAALRRHAGASLFAPDDELMQVMLAASPHRVFISRIGRAEIFQPIPPPGGRSPDGPHTHILPKLLAHRRTHAATEPLPDGWIPCAHAYPPHPLRDPLRQPRPFVAGHLAAFQHLLDRYGDPRLLALKRDVTAHVVANRPPSAADSPGDRIARATARVTLRQLQASGVESATLRAWLGALDRPDHGEEADTAEIPH